MADESMVRTLAAQATAIWPQERPLLDRYGLGAGSRVLDAGCGTGEFAARVAEAFPAVHVTGVDLIEASLETARQRHPDLAARLAFAFAGGALMGMAARAARGCTSGQALSGGAVLSVGAWVFMMAVFAGGYAFAWFMRRQWR